MKKYLLKGSMCIGRSDLSPSGRTFKSVEFTLLAKNDKEAREKIKNFRNVINPELFGEIDLEESVPTITPV